MDDVVPKLAVGPLNTTFSYRNQAYDALKRAITQMDVYGHRNEIRLDERQLSQDLGVSRTPIREAMSLLEQEGFVRTEARDRKSTRLNSSHSQISYAVFCLKKKIEIAAPTPL